MRLRAARTQCPLSVCQGFLFGGSVVGTWLICNDLFKASSPIVIPGCGMDRGNSLSSPSQLLRTLKTVISY